MFKKDLKNGMKVVQRCGDVMIFIDNVLYETDGYERIDKYHENLLFNGDDDYDTKYDIIEVYESERESGRFLSFKCQEAKIIWKRPEKTEAQLKLGELQRTIEDAQRQIAELKEEI